jgi:hypothetical protein
MKKLITALAVIAMPFAVTGCATIAAQSGKDEVATYDERALLTAEFAYGAALEGIATANTFGLISPEVATEILPKLESAQAAITKARALYDANRLVEAASASDSAALQVAILLQLLIDAGVIS